MSKCYWCNKEKKSMSDWEQESFRGKEIVWLPLCKPCATKRLNNPYNAFLSTRKVTSNDTDNPQFLALVAKVDFTLDVLSHFQQPLEPSTMEYDLDWTSRALKVAIMAHEPDESGYCKSCFEDIDNGDYDNGPITWTKFPCKSFLAIEAEVVK